MQMFEDFLESYFPQVSRAETSRARKVSTLADVISVDTSPRLLGSSVDALCYVHTGTTRQDQLLLYASQTSYADALSLIRHRIMSSSSNQSSTNRRDVILSILIIGKFDEASHGIRAVRAAV